MRRIALLCPNEWDREMLAQAPASPHTRFTVKPFGEDGAMAPGGFEADRFIDELTVNLELDPVDGVTSSGDYPGILVSSFVTDALGLPGPSPTAVLQCAHKYYSRIAQSMAVPEATPRFGLLHPDAIAVDALPMGFPFFVKPVKSSFSQFARRVDNWQDLIEYCASIGLREHLTTIVRPFNDLLRRHGGFDIDGGWLIAEEVLFGRQVTFEGYIFGSRLEIVGIVDSIMYGRTLSFRYFGYPSTFVSAGVAARMRDVAERVLTWIGFDNGLFNIEFMYNESIDTIHIIEINPRMCGQFADLMEAVRGVNTYDVLLSLAAGLEPLPGLSGDYDVAASFALRHFGDAEVQEVPTQPVVSTLRELYPLLSLHSFYVPGQLLSDSAYEFDGTSYRYAVVNIAGTDWTGLFADFAQVEASLGFRLRVRA